MRVAIVAMGPTNRVWFDKVYFPQSREAVNQQAFDNITNSMQTLPYNDECLNGVVRLCESIGNAASIEVPYDEVWAINGMGILLRRVDKVFHMDNLVDQGREMPDVPIVTSEECEGYDCEVFPLQEVVDEFESIYFNNTIAYAVAYAIYKKVDHIGFFGCDFNPHLGSDARISDAGASCVEYWIREAERRGITYEIPQGCRLMGMDTDQALYGYKKQPEIFMKDKLLTFNGKWNVRNIQKINGNEE